MSSEEKSKENSIKVILGEETASVTFPNQDKAYSLYPLKILDMAKVEDYTKTSITEWKDSEKAKVLSKLDTMLYIVWLSLKKNEGYDKNFEQTAETFGLGDADALASIVAKILELSGMRVKKKEAPVMEESAPK